jgi:hypothetical protein
MSQSETLSNSSQIIFITLFSLSLSLSLQVHSVVAAAAPFTKPPCKLWEKLLI